MKRQATLALLLLLLPIAGVLVAQDYSGGGSGGDWPFRYHNPYAEEERPAIADPERPECDHTSDSFSRFEVMRLTPPVAIDKFTSDGFIHWRHRQVIGDVHVDETTDKPSNFDLAVKDTRWWILYCSKCKHAYSIVRAEKRQMRTAKDQPKEKP